MAPATPLAVSASRRTGCCQASCALSLARIRTTAVVIPAVASSCGRPIYAIARTRRRIRIVGPTRLNGRSCRASSDAMVIMPPRAFHTASAAPRWLPRLVLSAPKPAAVSRSVPTLAIDRRSSRRSNDGQMIFKAVLQLLVRPLTCIFSRDGGIRTRGLLLPKLVQYVDPGPAILLLRLCNCA
jgi:hypothetical protein